MSILMKNVYKSREDELLASGEISLELAQEGFQDLLFEGDAFGASFQFGQFLVEFVLFDLLVEFDLFVVFSFEGVGFEAWGGCSGFLEYAFFRVFAVEYGGQVFDGD